MTPAESSLLAVAGAVAAAQALGTRIPSDVRSRLFLKPEGKRLRLVVRAPLAAMTDSSGRPRGAAGPARAEPVLREAATAWVASRIDIYEEDRRLRRLAWRRACSLPSDTSFDSYDRALAHVLGPPLADDTEVVTARRSWTYCSSTRSSRQVPAVDRDPVRSDGPAVPDRPAVSDAGRGGASVPVSRRPGLVRLDPRWLQAAWRFVVDGFFHILDGVDHLLFLVCLVIPFRRVGRLVPVVTAFTVAHSITLIASAYDMAPGALWFPPLVETLIAASIVYMALENIVSPHCAAAG